MTTVRRSRRTAGSSRPVRSVAAAALAAGMALGLAGCSATNPITSQMNYAPSDGVRVTLEDLTVQNLLVVSAAEGEAGTVSGAVANDGAADAEVELRLDDGTVVGSFDVPAGQNVKIGPSVSDENEVGTVQLQVEEVPAPPGAMMTMTIASDRGGSTVAQVPVLDGTLPPYEDLLP